MNFLLPAYEAKQSGWLIIEYFGAGFIPLYAVFIQRKEFTLYVDLTLFRPWCSQNLPANFPTAQLVLEKISIMIWIIVFIVLGITLWYFWKEGKVFSPSRKQAPPKEILKKRYAEGEISEAEFEDKMSRLES